MVRIGIFGAGVAGLSAAYHLGSLDYVVLEADSKIGGHACSVLINGFTFDYGPHILYSKNDYVKNLLREVLGSNILFDRKRRNYIYVYGRYVPFPFEANLHKMPRRVVEECVIGVVRRRTEGAMNFFEWIKQTFGEGIAKHYMIPYNEKLWKHDLSKMNFKWVADRVVNPSLEEIIVGALRAQRKRFGLNAYFWYPKVGGIGAIPEALGKRVRRVGLNRRVANIKAASDGLKVTTADNSYFFDVALSSIPLPEIVKIFDDVPTEVERAADNLVHNSLCSVFVGLKGDGVPRWTAAYFPDKTLNFHRISFPKAFSSGTVPPGMSSINVEVTYRKDEVIEREAVALEAVEGLREVGIIGRSEEPIFLGTYVSKYAYVVYDLEHEKNTRLIHEFMRSRNMIPIGRFGEWEYLNTDHAILSGKRGADLLLNPAENKFKPSS